MSATATQAGPVDVARGVTPIDRLFVLWCRPDDGTRYVVGQLWRERPDYCFAYDHRVGAALEAGFVLLPEFSELRHADDPYRSRYLFATFGQRIPPLQRPDFAALMAEWGVEHADDPFEILARSGGIQMTDRLELAEYRAPGDDLRAPLDFRIAGVRRAGEPAMAIGQPVSFRREPDNTYDPCAVLVVDARGAKLGYVPRHYSDLFARALDSGVALSGEITRQLVVPESKWIVRAHRDR